MSLCVRFVITILSHPGDDPTGDRLVLSVKGPTLRASFKVFTARL